MRVEVQYERYEGVIEVHEDGSFKVEFPGCQSKKEAIEKKLAKGIESTVDFKHPGIPGKIKTSIKVTTDEDFKVFLNKLEKDIGVWVHTIDKDLSMMPWFGRKGFVIKASSGDDDSPWFLVEDVATGIQAFICGASKMGDPILWHRQAVIDTAIVKDWTIIDDEYIESLEIIYCW